MRRLVLLAAACGAAVLAAGAGSATTPSCRTPEVQVHDEAVFGHFARRSEALRLARRARAVDFKGIRVENDGCGDFEVEVDGADRTADRSSFAAEAAKAHFQVTFEQTQPPLMPPKGQVYGVLARSRSLARMDALARRAAGDGFRYLDLAYAGGRWEVVMPQVPVKDALSIAAEVHKAGLHIAFRQR